MGPREPNDKGRFIRVAYRSEIGEGIHKEAGERVDPGARKNYTVRIGGSRVPRVKCPRGHRKSR